MLVRWYNPAMMRHDRYRCVFLDWHGTLSTDRLWGHHPGFAALAAPLFAPTGDLAALLLPWLRGALASEAVVRALAEAGGVAYAPALREFIVGCRRTALVSAEIPPLIAALRGRGVTVAIATDNTDAFARWTVPSLGLGRLVDAILCSSDLGAVKPDTDDCGRSLFFDAFLRRAGLGPGESVLLDDSPDAGGRIAAFGIDYHRITPATGGLVPALRRLAHGGPRRGM